MALRMLGNEDDAADVVQNVWTLAARSAGRFTEAAAVSTWLHRIAVNAALDLRRRRDARPQTAI